MKQNFLWKLPNEVDKDKIKEELADIFCYSLILADFYELDVNKIINEKIEKNNIKYPVEKAKGTNKKYDQL